MKVLNGMYGMYGKITKGVEVTLSDIDNYNKFAAAVHFIFAIIVIIFIAIGLLDINLPIYTSLLGKIEVIFEFNFAWLLFIYELVTAGFHFYYLTSSNYKQSLQKLQNPYRWIEYSVTATCMILGIAGLTLLGDFLTLLQITVSSISLMYIGYFIELYNPDYLKEIESNKTLPDTLKTYQKQIKLLISGIVLYFNLWTPVIYGFANANSKAEELGGETAPWFVWVLIIYLFTTFSIFPVLQIASINDIKNEKQNGEDDDDKIKKYRKWEKYFIILSFTSKVGDVLILLIGYLGSNNEWIDEYIKNIKK